MADTTNSSMFDNLMSGISGLGNSLIGWINGTNTSGSTLNSTLYNSTVAPTNDVKLNAILSGDSSGLNTINSTAVKSTDYSPVDLSNKGFDPTKKVKDLTVGERYNFDKMKALEADEAGGMFGLNKSTIDNGIGLANLGKDIYGMFNAAKLTKASLNNLNTNTNIMKKNEARTAEEYGRIKAQRANNNAAYGGK